MKIGIFYICTGKYAIFWNGFYESCQRFFLPQEEKQYFVFTDAPEIQDTACIKVYAEQPKGFPLDSLLRFDMFLKAEADTRSCDYLFFFNANMEFKKNITPEMILPTEKESGLTGVLHPGYYDKRCAWFLPFEKHKASAAYMQYNPKENYCYFMGGVNGGTRQAYYELVRTCSRNTAKDWQRNFVAVYHDESHLNCYFHGKKIKMLSPAFGYPEDSRLPFEPLILIRDKIKHGGQYFDKLPTKAYWRRLKFKLQTYYRGILWVMNL